MKKRKDDEGLIYMKELGFRPAKSGKAFYSALEEHLGVQYADDFWNAVATRTEENRDDGNIRNQEIYNVINRSYNSSMVVSGFYSADYYRHICNWLIENKDYVKGNVLDACCGNGIIACFVASRFPECNVVGVDCVESSINVAKELAKRMNLTNVSFVVEDIRNYSSNRKFDTVISTLSMVPFVSDTFCEPRIYGYTKSLKAVVNELREASSDYATILSNFTNDNGYMLQVERNGYDVLEVGWLINMNNNGFSQVSDFKDMKVLEGGEETNFVKWILCKNNFEIISADEFYERWVKYIIKNSHRVDNRLWEDSAQATMEFYHFEQEKGFIVRSKKDENENQSIACGWLHINGEKEYVEYTITYNSNEEGYRWRNRCLFFVDKNRPQIPDFRTQILADINDWKDTGERYGHIIEPHYFGGDLMS